MNTLSSLAQPQSSPQGYSGTVMFQGQPIQVQNGQAEFDGERFIVSDDGMLVVNDKRQFVGTIQDGEFIEVTPELIDQFKQMGVFEGEQSQGMAPQAQG